MFQALHLPSESELMKADCAEWGLTKGEGRGGARAAADRDRDWSRGYESDSSAGSESSEGGGYLFLSRDNPHYGARRYRHERDMEPRIFDLWITKVSKCPRVKNYKRWGCNSYAA